MRLCVIALQSSFPAALLEVEGNVPIVDDVGVASLKFAGETQVCRQTHEFTFLGQVCSQLAARLNKLGLGIPCKRSVSVEGLTSSFCLLPSILVARNEGGGAAA